MMTKSESSELDAQIALDFAERAIRDRQKKSLTDVQREIFLGCWAGKSYKEIHQAALSRYELEYLMRDVGPKLWKLLSLAFDTSISKNNLRGPIELNFRETRALAPDVAAEVADRSLPATLTRHDWGNAPDVPFFYGRWQELETLGEGIALGQYRLVVIAGMGQIGKTTLAVKLAERVREQFDFLIWRSLHPPYRMTHLVQDVVQLLTNQPHPSSDVPQLLHLLRHHRCLIILDGLERVLRPSVHDGSYQPGYEDYRDLFWQLGTIDHQSCIILTTREQLKELERLTLAASPVCVRNLAGLGEIAIQEFLAARNILGSEHHWRELFRRYGGNPFVLDRMCRLIHNFCRGDLNHFLTQANLGLPGDVRQLLEEQLGRLSDLERRIVEHLTHVPTPITVQDLAEMLHPHDFGELIEGLESLSRRSLVDVNKSQHYLLNSLVKAIARKA